MICNIRIERTAFANVSYPFAVREWKSVRLEFHNQADRSIGFKEDGKWVRVSYGVNDLVEVTEL